MSSNVEINGANFLPIKEAAKLVSYSKDYLAKLAREEKIVATQINRQWFIDLISLRSFEETANMEKSVLKLRLSAQRKREQVVKSEMLSIKEEAKLKIHKGRLQAQLVSMFVLGFGLVSGVAIYTTTAIFSSPIEINTARLSSAVPATSLPALVEESPIVLAPPETLAVDTNLVQPLFIDESEIRSMKVGDKEGILLLARSGPVQSPEAVAALFSDEVSVYYTSDNTGVVTYTTTNEETKDFPFVSVPIKATSTTTEPAL
jgi:hypothetical protein